MVIATSGTWGQPSSIPSVVAGRDLARDDVQEGPFSSTHKQFLQDFCSCPSKKYLPLTDSKGAIFHMLSTGNMWARGKMASHFPADFLVSVLALPGLSLVFTSRY